MSSRALRRLQREEAERKQLEEDKKDSEEDDDYEQERPSPKGQNQRNAFNFLIAEEQDGEPSEDDDQVKEPDKKSTDPSILTHDSTKSKKKGKKKRKKLSKTATPEPEIEQDLDEIDQALKSLSTGNSTKEEATQVFDQGLRTFYQILSTDSKHLNPLNEMKKLFGSTVLDSNRGTTEARRHGRGTTQLDLGAALTGRHSQVSRGQGLAGLALRRNALMVGKEEWPKATSGGLGMMIVEEATDFTVEYKFVHSSMYQSIQRQFDLCVETMDPQRMISHLQLNRKLTESTLSIAKDISSLPYLNVITSF